MESSAHGHRQRLLTRFAKSGIESFHDYEIIELLLTFFIPRKDTKPIARELLRRFKSVGAVLGASSASLSEINGIGDRCAEGIRFVHELSSFCLLEKYSGRTIVSCKADVENYLRFTYGSNAEEYMVVLFMDSGNRVIATEEIFRGTVNRCAVYPREIFLSAIKERASSMIIAHNHPGGTLTPSTADWKITRQIFDAGKLIEISLLDHVIIADQKVISLRDFPEWPR